MEQVLCNSREQRSAKTAGKRWLCIRQLFQLQKALVWIWILIRTGSNFITDQIALPVCVIPHIVWRFFLINLQGR